MFIFGLFISFGAKSNLSEPKPVKDTERTSLYIHTNQQNYAMYQVFQKLLPVKKSSKLNYQTNQRTSFFISIYNDPNTFKDNKEFQNAVLSND